MTKLWYCLDCGHYAFEEPLHKARTLREVWVCPVCQSEGAIDLEVNNERLASFARETKEEWPSGRFDDPRPQYRPLNYLAKAISQAEHFVHIATESIDGFFLGMLAVKHFEHDIEQRVIVWHPQKRYQDLEHLMNHSTIVKGYERRQNLISRGLLVATITGAHQKLIVVDGCLAFKGSANATLDGWTEQGNLIEFVADRGEIQRLNQTYFAQFMAKKRAG